MSQPVLQNNIAKTHQYQEYVSRLDPIFEEMASRIRQMKKSPKSFKPQKFPLTKIKKIMKEEEDIQMISAEVPVLLSKACEMFITEITHRSYFHTKRAKRKVIQRSDLAQTIASDDIYDYLQDVMPKEELREAQENNSRGVESMVLRPIMAVEKVNKIEISNELTLPEVDEADLNMLPDNLNPSPLQDVIDDPKPSDPTLLQNSILTHLQRPKSLSGAI
ncbi:unnamed protein product [Moneuplotes crassus]|uniref:Transcription factor CBF/NF-Y/archaeal histone domain-containing protein n=1 Tax=Euplotes crassus TaxID=5936 RepID=A0AAD1XR56_EUPCR|nr:unnamed protein product [Moneuplotes crassus]